MRNEIHLMHLDNNFARENFTVTKADVWLMAQCHCPIYYKRHSVKANKAFTEQDICH